MRELLIFFTKAMHSAAAARDAKHLFGPAVEQGDSAVSLDDQDGVRQRLDQGPDALVVKSYWSHAIEKDLFEQIRPK